MPPLSQLPSLNYDRLVAALRRGGWQVVRQRGSHIRLQKRAGVDLLKVTVPAHSPIKRTTLAAILNAARLSPEALRELL